MSERTGYRTPQARRSAVAEVLGTLEKSDRVILTTHMNADGDGTGCEVALAAWLRHRGAEAWIVNPTPYPDMYRFLVPDSSWVVSAGSQLAVELCAGADLAVVLDTGEIPRLGRVKPMIDPLLKVVVDHHQPGDQPIPGVALRDASACATGELVYDLVLASSGEGGTPPRHTSPWPQATLDGLYVAILTDTGSFRFSNSTPSCHRVAAELIERGANPEALHRQAYGASPLRSFRLLQASLGTLEVDEGGRVAWMTVPPDAFERLGAEADDLEGLVDYPRNVEGVEVGLLFRQASDGSTKISFRSNGEVDVNALARQFGGGGHVRAAGARVDRPLEEVRPAVVRATREAVSDVLGG